MVDFMRTCICGRNFVQDNALTNHQRTCPRTRDRLADTLTRARALHRPAKRRRLADEKANSLDSRVSLNDRDASDINQIEPAPANQANETLVANSSTRRHDGVGLRAAHGDFGQVSEVCVPAIFACVIFQNQCRQLPVLLQISPNVRVVLSLSKNCQLPT